MMDWEDRENRYIMQITVLQDQLQACKEELETYKAIVASQNSK
jgi:hypothetical protein